VNQLMSPIKSSVKNSLKSIELSVIPEVDNTRIRCEFTNQLINSKKEKTNLKHSNSTRDISHYHDLNDKGLSKLERDTKHIINMLTEDSTFVLPTDIVELEIKFKEK